MLLSSFWSYSCNLQITTIVFRFPTNIFVFVVISRPSFLQKKQSENSQEYFVRISKVAIYLCQGLILTCCFQKHFQIVSLAQNLQRSIFRQKYGFIYGVSLISKQSTRYVPLFLKNGCIKFEIQQD